MKNGLQRSAAIALAIAASFVAIVPAQAAPRVTRLTPPSELFSSGRADPIIARFLPGQRFDLQATVQPDAGQVILRYEFYVDGQRVTNGVMGETTQGLVSGLAANTKVVSIRGYSTNRSGVRQFKVRAWQADGQSVEATGNFEIVPVTGGGERVKNVIIMLGDGMGASHRTAARIMLNGYVQGKSRSPLAMDTFPQTAMVKTASLNSIITDSAPGMASYVTGNKHANNQEGVFPDDTSAPFDNPRTEYLGEYFARTYGKALGIVTTSDVFDATPASMAIYTANRGAGTGIADQYLDDAPRTGLKVLMGGGRKWFLPNTTPGSARVASLDYVLPGEISAKWGSAPGRIDPQRNLVADFQRAGWEYVATGSEMDAAAAASGRLLGLFAYSNMNVALDKIDGRRGASPITADYGLPDQPMLDEMTAKALDVLERDNDGFMLLVEAASIDKQAHNMDIGAVDPRHDRIRPGDPRCAGLCQESSRHAGAHHRRPRVRRCHHRGWLAPQQRRPAGARRERRGCRQAAHQRRGDVRSRRIPALHGGRRRLPRNHRRGSAHADRIRRECRPLRGLADQCPAADGFAAARHVAGAAGRLSERLSSQPFGPRRGGQVPRHRPSRRRGGRPLGCGHPIVGLRARRDAVRRHDRQ